MGRTSWCLLGVRNQNVDQTQVNCVFADDELHADLYVHLDELINEVPGADSGPALEPSASAISSAMM